MQLLRLLIRPMGLLLYFTVAMNKNHSYIINNTYIHKQTLAGFIAEIYLKTFTRFRYTKIRIKLISVSFCHVLNHFLKNKLSSISPSILIWYRFYSKMKKNNFSTTSCYFAELHATYIQVLYDTK